MDAQVKRAEAKLKKDVLQVPCIRDMVAKWKEELQSLPESSVAFKKLHCRITNAENRCDYISSGEPARKLRQKAAPFLRAFDNMSLATEEERKNKKRRTNRLPGRHMQKKIDTPFVTKMTKREMLAEYLTLTDGSVGLPELEVEDGCPLCNIPLIVVDKKAQATCTRCGFSRQYLESTTANVQYNSDMEFSSFSYKRVNHFNDWMAVIQARESTEVTDEIMEKVMDELHARRFTSVTDINIPLIKEILKKLKLRNAYENTTQIVCRLTGKPPPRLHPHLEECCRIMFIQIQPSFEKHKHSRKNFLSYSYTLFKFLQLLGVEDVPMLHFTLLKGRDKLEKQDQIFKKICGDLDWEFIPSC
jgi:hypothetical protein